MSRQPRCALGGRLAAVVLLAGLMGCDAGPARAQGGGAVTGRPAASVPARDSATIRLDRAVAQYRRGEHDAAMREFAAITRAFGQRSGASASELMAVAEAFRHLGRRDPARFRDALSALDDAIAAEPSNPEPQVRAGELFLEKYNSREAQEAFAAVLAAHPEHARALLGSARRLQFDGAPGAQELARKAVAADPSLVPARVFLASLHLDGEDYAEAEAEGRRALATDSTSLEAMALLSAVARMRGDDAGFGRLRDRVLRQNPRYAPLYTTLAELSARHRRYGDAVSFARQAIALDSTEWRAHGLLGINQLRTGAMDEGRRSLEAAFAGDPYDVWTKNTLDLLDTQRTYAETTSPRFQILVEQSESALLAPYLTDLSELAYRRLAARYDYRPARPIRLEVYRRHADFSVRTVGLTGFGALGVSFGDVLAMNSPAARPQGSFNWGGTAWHEIAHTFTLGATDQRVPRWLSEGLSVLEERRARPGWGAEATLDFVVALRTGRLLPVSRLNDGFVRPSYPAQIIHSYYQASLVCELIERDFGWPAMTALLRGYREGSSTEDLVRRVLKLSMAELDQRAEAYLHERFAVTLAALKPGPEAVPGSAAEAVALAARDPGSLGAQLGAGRLLLAAGRATEAVPYLERAKALAPNIAINDGPHELLASIHLKSGALRQAADELARHTALDDSDYEANVELGRLLTRLADSAGAVAALERAIYISPYDPAVHLSLAELYAAAGDRPGVVRERRAVVALDPVDRPEALYQLAVSLRDAGDAAGARSTVLRALELAPSFAKAQELLLALRRTSGSGGS